MSMVEWMVSKVLAHMPTELASQVPVELIYLAAMVLSASLLLGMFVAPIAGFSTYIERRVAARMQARIGCNRVGPEGLLQFLADGLKLLMKEDNTPQGADKPMFKMAPFLVVMGAFMSFVCIPFGPNLFVSNMNVGLMYLISVSSFAVVGILLAGWASNNKWSLLGSMRSAAQIVSYEIPLGLALMVVVLMAGSLNLNDIVQAQSGGLRHWFIFQYFPGPFIAFFVYFIAALAEVNRTPFDLPEAESELVSGYNTEYSGIRWGMFFVAEYANMFLVSAISVTAFFGGWNPSRSHVLVSMTALFFTLLLIYKISTYLVDFTKSVVIKRRKVLHALNNTPNRKLTKPVWIALAVISLAMAIFINTISHHPIIIALIFVGKCYFFVFVMMWIRWTLPRYRVDQMMDLCWKKLIPIAMFCLLWTGFWMLWSVQ